jgi:C-terminal processing protease CtpA/Prc
LQELIEVGAQQNPELKELRDRLGKARIHLQAAKEEDGVVVSRLHVDGAAYKSGRISNGDIISKVDGVTIGIHLC